MEAAVTQVSRVEKIHSFRGSLPERSLYVYLPPGYDQEPRRRYPVLYMHDGQNCFEAFDEDSFAGSWQADLVADRLIAAGEMRPCLIVGVSNGGRQRMAEYLPPYASYLHHSLHQPPSHDGHAEAAIDGRADRTFDYYQHEVARFLQANFRVLTGREHTATCGSSLGGLFSAYIAWERPTFARHHAMMSPSFWITCTYPDRREGPFEAIERMRTGQPRDLRLWLDSGTRNSRNGKGNDGMEITRMARDALLDNGFVEGENFRYYLHEGGIHHESSWAERLPMVFRFLFPPER